MPLTSAAQWIATKGGNREFTAEDAVAWQPAFEELLAAITSSSVELTGLKNGKRKLLAGHKISDCQVCFPFQEPDMRLYKGDEYYLMTYTVDSEEEWRDGFSDKLVRRGKETWTRLTVAKAHVMALWPFPSVPARSRVGRPGKVFKILQELDRRDERGETYGSQVKEAEALRIWLHTAYPGDEVPEVSTIIKAAREHRAK